MEKDFDFKKIGKNTPYSTPEGFFDDMQKKILSSAERNIRKRKKVKFVVISMLAVAAAFAGFVFFPIGNDITQSQQQQLAKSDTTEGKTPAAHSSNTSTYSSAKENDRGVVNVESQNHDKKTKNTASSVRSDRNLGNEEWIEQLSDEDLRSLTSMADNDEFLN